MRTCLFLSIFCFIVSCTSTTESPPFTGVDIEILYRDSLSIRAIELMPGSLAFAANKGVFGTVDLSTHKVRTNIQQFDSILPEFRAVAHTKSDFFMLSVANPALLYKTGNKGTMELVYSERDSLVFYDAMKFWNDQEGIAIGDSMNGCLSVIITRDGGQSWNKLDCEKLPEAAKGEGAFAASNTNIAIIGDHCWVATTSGRIYYSADKGTAWELFDTPIINELSTQGIYSIDFYNESLGIVIGGDYTAPDGNKKNKALSTDGGRSWKLLADGVNPGYKSCVQFVPGTGGKGIVALGFTGISYSGDQGHTWKSLSNESFYTLRFLNDTIAYAAGRNRIAKLTFK
ncbi:MAG: WD40/YVTN/BNR-like repeat-containing protein [Flavobacteriaceae bacterium]